MSRELLTSAAMLLLWCAVVAVGAYLLVAWYDPAAVVTP